MAASIFADYLLDENGNYIDEGEQANEDDANDSEIDFSECGDLSWLDTSS